MENLSNSRYVAIFTQCMGMPPVRYILELRLRYACQLLESTDMSIKEISALSGYSDPHFFSKQFKKYIGVSPRDYRT
jgi:AraC-like DNA-binding protein